MRGHKRDSAGMLHDCTRDPAYTKRDRVNEYAQHFGDEADERGGAKTNVSTNKSKESPRHNLYSWVGGWCRRTCKPSAGKLSRTHDLFVKFSSTLSLLRNGADDAERAFMGGFMAIPKGPRNLPVERNRSEVQRREQKRTILRSSFSL